MMTETVRARRGRPRSKNTHQGILDAANRLIAEHGYSGFSIEGVAKLARVSKASIYRRWLGKGELLLDLYMAEMLVDPLITQELSFKPALESYLLLSVRQLSKPWWRNALKSLVAEAQGDPKLAEQIQAKVIEPRRAAARGLLLQGMANKAIRKNIDIDIVLDMVFGAMWYRLIFDHLPFDETFAHSLVEQAFSWIGANMNDKPTSPSTSEIK